MKALLTTEGDEGDTLTNGSTSIKINSSIIDGYKKPKFYGFKVTQDGIYYCNGSHSWTKWNPS